MIRFVNVHSNTFHSYRVISLRRQPLPKRRYQGGEILIVDVDWVCISLMHAADCYNNYLSIDIEQQIIDSYANVSYAINQ